MIEKSVLFATLKFEDANISQLTLIQILLKFLIFFSLKFEKMSINKLIKNLKKFYRKTFNPTEDEINFDSFIKFTLLSFRMILFDFQYLDENATLKMKVNFYARKFFSMFAIASCIFSVLQVIMFAIDNSGNFEVVVRAISDASALFFYALNGVILFLKKEDIRKILEELKSLFESRKHDNQGSVEMKRCFDGYNRVMKVLTAIAIFGNVTCGAFWIPYLINGLMYYEVNLWSPFDDNSSAKFPVSQLWTQWLTYVVFSVIMFSSSLLYALSTIISMEFDFLKSSLRFIKLQTKDELASRVAYVIDRHNKLFEISDKVRIIFEPICFYNFLISSLIMCSISFQLLTTASDPLTYMIDINYFTTFASQIWLLCSLGQKLIDSSLAVADEIYGCDWTDLVDNEFKKQMIIVMIRAQRPIKLTAMGFADISLETFAAVKYFVVCNFVLLINISCHSQILSSTYSYFSLMKTFYNRN